MLEEENKLFCGNEWDLWLGSLQLKIGFNDNEDLCAALYEDKQLIQEVTWGKSTNTPINTKNTYLTNINCGSLKLTNSKSVLLTGNISEKGSQLVFSVILEMTPDKPCPNIRNTSIILKIPANDNSTYPADSGSKNVDSQILYSPYPAESGLFMNVTAPTEAVLIQGSTNSNAVNIKDETEFEFINDSIPNKSNRPIYVVGPDESKNAESDGTVASFKGTVSVGSKYEDIKPAPKDDKFSPATIKGTFYDNSKPIKNKGDFNLEIYWHAIF